MTNDHLNEIIGMRTYGAAYDNPANTTTTKVIPDQGDINFKPIQGKEGINLISRHCTSFHGWQQTVFNKLVAGQSIYVVARPGAGKTSPVICYWVQRLLALNPRMDPNNIRLLMNRVEDLIYRPESIPKVLFLVPVRALAELTYMEIIGDYADIILQSIRMFINVAPNGLGDRRVQNLFRQIFYGTNSPQSRNVEQSINILNNEYISLYNGIMNGQLDQNDQPTRKRMEYLVNEIQEKLAVLLKDFITNNLITQVSGTHGANRSVITKSPFIVAIYESGANLIRGNYVTSQNVGVVVVDEAHLAQYESSKGPDRKVAESIYEILKKLSTTNTQFVFMSGTINPTAAKNLANYVKTCFRRNIEVLDDLNSAGNASEIRVIPNDNLLDDNYLLKTICNPQHEANLFIIFSKARILKLVSQAIKIMPARSAQQTMQEAPYNYNHGAKKDNRFSQETNLSRLTQAEQRRYENIEKNKPFIPSTKMREMVTRMPGVEDVTDPLLQQALLSGIGYVFRPDEVTGDEEEKTTNARHLQIVTDLFAKGKIRTLLATDAVGIGVNLRVLAMYIPSVTKYGGPGRGQEKLETGNAAQLFARVGRSAFPKSFIYTPSHCVADITNAMSTLPEQFQERVTLETPSKEMCLSANVFRSIWTATHGFITN